jgi:hypothetical protein
VKGCSPLPRVEISMVLEKICIEVRPSTSRAAATLR